MTQSLESMRRRIGSAEDLYAVVRVMKALAAASIRQCERAVESLAEYSDTIEAGLQVVVQEQPAAIGTQPAAGRRCGIIVFGSDQGMCGAFNEQVASCALETLDGCGASAQERTLLVVGMRVAGRLEDAGHAVDELFPMPSTVSGIGPAVGELLLRVEALRFQHGVERFLLVHQRPAEPSGYRPDSLQLLPIDPGWLGTLATKDWPSRSLPLFTMNRHQLFSALIRQHLLVVLYRAFAESMAGENASRLAAMHSAERNIQDHLSRLTIDYHQERQQSITEELLDIVAGFETLSGKKARRAEG